MRQDKPAPKMMVVDKDGALETAMEHAGITTGYRLWKLVEGRYGRPGKATVQNLCRHAPGTYGISITFATNIATILGQPVEAIFAHPDGAELR